MVYEIDLGQHTLSINADLPSSDPAFQFHAELNVEWMAVDPSAIVRYRIANVEEAVSPDLLRLARGITRGFSIAEAAEAEDKINEELGSDSIEVTDEGKFRGVVQEAAQKGRLGSKFGLWVRTTARLQQDEAAAAHYAKMKELNWQLEEEEAAHQLRIRKEENERYILQSRMTVYRDIIQSGDIELFVLQLASNPGDTAAVLKVFREEKEQGRRNFIDFVSRLIDSGVVERWQVGDQARVALEWLKDEIAGVIPDRGKIAELEGGYRQQRTGRPDPANINEPAPAEHAKEDPGQRATADP